MQRIAKNKMYLVDVKRPSPLGFPLMVERFGSMLSNESLIARVERMKAQWSKADLI